MLINNWDKRTISTLREQQVAGHAGLLRRMDLASEQSFYSWPETTVWVCLVMSQGTWITRRPDIQNDLNDKFLRNTF